MNSRILLLLLVFCACPAVHAGKEFTPGKWTKGLHLLAGGGLNTSYFTSGKYREAFGMGLNFKTDLGYYLDDKWAVEWSSIVKFNRIRDYLVWDSLFTLGLRFRSGVDFIRVFYGRAPTVFYPDEDPVQFRDRSVRRLQYDGPVYGLGVGRMFPTQYGGTGYVELTGTYQRFEKERLIGTKGEAPVVLTTSEPRPADLLGFVVSVGLLIF